MFIGHVKRDECHFIANRIVVIRMSGNASFNQQQGGVL